VEQWAEVVQARRAEVVARFVGGLADGGPALTRASTGEGAAWYLAADPDEAGARRVLGLVLPDAGVERHEDIPEGVEIVRRGEATFVINHGQVAARVAVSGVDLLTGESVDAPKLAPFGVLVLQASSGPLSG
jgi:beta-galactosidase